MIIRNSIKQKIPKLWEAQKENRVLLQDAQRLFEDNKKEFREVHKSHQSLSVRNHFETEWVQPEWITSETDEETGEITVTVMSYSWSIEYTNLPSNWIEYIRPVGQYRLLSKQDDVSHVADSTPIWTLNHPSMASQINGSEDLEDDLVRVYPNAILNVDIYLEKDDEVGLAHDIEVRLAIDMINPSFYV